MSKLGKYSDPDVAEAASRLKKAWQAQVDAAKANKAAAAPAAAAPAPAPVKKESPAVKAEPAPQVKAETAVMPEPSSSAAEPSSSDAAVKDEGPVPLTGSTSFSVQWRAAQKTGNAVRDQVRAQLQKVFEKGKEANGKFLHGQVTDTALMAEEAESHMLQTLGDSIAGPSKEYKARFRSLVFNLSDSKNPVGPVAAAQPCCRPRVTKPMHIPRGHIASTHVAPMHAHARTHTHTWLCPHRSSSGR